MSNFSFTTVADALNGVVDGTAAANKAVVLDANSKISGLITTDLKVDDSDTGIVITSSDQTHASPVVTIPDITDAADTFVVADTAQTLTNKTLTTPIVASVYQDAEKTKLMTIPNTASDTLVGLAATQTLTNKTLTSPKINEDVVMTATSTQLNEAGSKASATARLYNLGAPVIADVDRLVTSTNMIVGEYTIDGSQPDIPRNVTVTVTAGDTADTMGTITFTGTNYNDEEISEEITPVAGSTVEGAKAFKTVTTIVGAGWVIDGSESTNDTITIGIGNEIGLPIALDVTSEVMLGILGTTITATNAIVGDPATIEETTIDLSAGTYDGSKEILVFIVD